MAGLGAALGEPKDPAQKPPSTASEGSAIGTARCVAAAVRVSGLLGAIAGTQGRYLIPSVPPAPLQGGNWSSQGVVTCPASHSDSDIPAGVRILFCLM